MKDQYVGDISDFEKYAILRAAVWRGRLARACGRNPETPYP